MNLKRIYLDYNATSPLFKKSLDFLDSGDFYFANPSSQHKSGKFVSRLIKKAESDLLTIFNLRESFKTVFHSGATEAMNTFFNLDSKDCFVYSCADHLLLKSIANKLKGNGVEVIELSVKKDGMLDLDNTIKRINNRVSKGKCWMNYTWMNNETGVVWSLEDAQKIKDSCNIQIHVDAVQTPGKVQGWNNLNLSLDGYSYSGHKFGALKGIGFSFINNDTSFEPLIYGGGQQDNLRSGTLNTYGILSLVPALQNLKEEYFKKKLNAKIMIQTLIEKNSNLSYVKNTSNNTICLIHKSLKSDVLFIHFDMAGFDVSMGSACSSGSIEKSHVLEAMGYNKLSSNSIRLSLGEISLRQELDLIGRLKILIGKL